MNVYKLLIVTVFVLLVGCDNPDQLKEASKDFDPSKDLQLADFIDAADSMAFFNCESNEPVFASRLKKDFDELAKALSFGEKKECRGICFDKQWPSFYLELYRNGEPIDSTHIYAAHESKGYLKRERLSKKRYSYYIVDSVKLKSFFESRHITKLPFECEAGKRWPKNDCGLSCRSVEASEIQITDSNGNAVSDTALMTFIDEIKKDAHSRYARYSADSNKHFDMEGLVEMRIANDFIADFSFKSIPKIEPIELIMKEMFEFGTCLGCSDGIKLVKFKLSFKDNSPKDESKIQGRSLLATKSLENYIAQADSMAVISCYPEEPTPLLPKKKTKALNSISSSSKNFASAPFKDEPQPRRIPIHQPKLTSYVVYSSNNRKDLDEFADAVAFKDSEYCDGFCFDKQWSSYYVELFKNGEFIDGTHFYTGPDKGYIKELINYYFADVSKVHDFFNSRNVFPMPWGCRADIKRWRNFKDEKSKN